MEKKLERSGRLHFKDHKAERGMIISQDHEDAMQMQNCYNQVLPDWK